MTQNIFNGDIFRVLQIRKHEIISQQSRHWCRLLRIREFVTVVQEECNGCSSEGFCCAGAVEERVDCCALVRNSCKSIALCRVSEFQHTGLEQAQKKWQSLPLHMFHPLYDTSDKSRYLPFRHCFSYNLLKLWRFVGPFRTKNLELN